MVWCGAYILPTFHAPHWFHHPPVRPWRPCLSFMRCWLGESKIISLSGGRAGALVRRVEGSSAYVLGLGAHCQTISPFLSMVICEDTNNASFGHSEFGQIEQIHENKNTPYKAHARTRARVDTHFCQHC